MKNLTSRLKSLAAVCALTMMILSPVALATSPPANQTLNPIQSACNTGNGTAASSAICQQANGTSASTNPANTVLHDTANTLALISAVIAVIMIVISGLTMVTSRGNSDAVAGARNRIIYAVVGLLVISAAWSIVTLLIDHL